MPYGLWSFTFTDTLNYRFKEILCVGGWVVTKRKVKEKQ